MKSIALSFVVELEDLDEVTVEGYDQEAIVRLADWEVARYLVHRSWDGNVQNLEQAAEHFADDLAHSIKMTGRHP